MASKVKQRESKLGKLRFFYEQVLSEVGEEFFSIKLLSRDFTRAKPFNFLEETPRML